MKRLLYILPFVLFAACKPHKFVCNQQLLREEVVKLEPTLKSYQKEDTITIANALQNHTTDHDDSLPKELKRATKKQLFFKKLDEKFGFLDPVNPSDSTIKDPGLKKAKDALALEEIWLKVFFGFLALGLLVLFSYMGIIELAALLSEEILSILLGIALLGYSVTYYGNIIVYLMHIGVYKKYPKEKERHMIFVLSFFLIPIILVILLVLLFL